MRVSLRLYRWLLRLYPAGFRERYGVPLEQEFRDEYSEVRGASGVARFWLRTLRDFAVSMPVQFAREVRQDARHAVRGWRRHPLPTAFAVAALAIAIGANTGVFSVLNALLLRSLPFHEPERVAWLNNFNPPRGNVAADFQAWYQRSAYLAEAAKYDTMEVNAGFRPGAHPGGDHDSARLRLTETSSNFFHVLGSAPVLGRAFLAGEDTPGRDAIAVIGYGLWQQLSGGDSSVLGSTLRVNGTPLTIVGIAPPGFDYPQQTAVWSPTTFDFQLIAKTDPVIFTSTIGRLKPGLSWAQARQAFETEASAADPERRQAGAVNRPALTPIQEQLAGPVKTASLILMAGVGLLLLMACASIANLLIGRTAARASELMIRTALGASRARLTQQLFTESVLLAGVAAIAGLLIGRWTTGIATSTHPAQLAGQAYTILDWRVFGFTTVLALTTGVLFGAGPALLARHAGGGSFARTITSSRGVRRTRNVLIAAQIAVSIVLFTGSIALGRAFISLLRVDNGFEIANAVTMRLSLAGTSQQDNGAAYYAEVLRRVREVPGVLSASTTQFLPLGTDAFSLFGFSLDAPPAATWAKATLILVGPDYFQTMGGRVEYGRDFTQHDAEGSEPVAIVSDGFASGFGDSSAAIGRSLFSSSFKPRTIVGVVHAMRYTPSFPAPSQVFFVMKSPGMLTVVARVNGNARDRLAIIRDAVQSIDPTVPVFSVKTMADRLDETLARPKFYATAAVFFGGLALLLAVIGVYGVVSYAVVQRTREMGIRLALGITPLRLRAVVLRQGFTVVALGVVPGVWGAIVCGRYLETLVRGAATGMVPTSGVAVAITAATAGVAMWSATRRIARLDVADVLRAETGE